MARHMTDVGSNVKEHLLDSAIKLVPVNDPGSIVEEHVTRTESSYCFKLRCFISSLNEQLQTISQMGDDEVPLPGRFASEFRFWKVSFIAVFLGMVMGLIGLGFMNIINQLPLYWVGNDTFLIAESFNLYQGKLYWIVIPTNAGISTGILRYLVSYPETSEAAGNLFKEINACYVDYKNSLYTLLISVVSLSYGANLGPEVALSNVGGGLGTYISELSFVNLTVESDRKLVVLSGIVGAIGALFPSPLLTVMTVFELGPPPRSLMESVVVMSFSAIAAYIINYWLLNKTFLDYIPHGMIVIGASWTYELSNCLTAFYIGLYSAAVNVILMLFIGIFKRIFLYIRILFTRNDLVILTYCIPPLLAGLIIGAINFSLPMTVGNGDLIAQSLIKFSLQNEISKEILLLSLLGRVATLAASLYSHGFIGGLVYPLMYIGLVSGILFFLNFPELPFGLCVACFTASVPSCLVPMPYTLTAFVCLLYGLDLYQSSAVYISVVTSYILISGTGIVHALQGYSKKTNDTIWRKSISTSAGTKKQLYENTSFFASSESFVNQSEDSVYVPPLATENNSREIN